MEDEVAQLTGITALRGERLRTRAVLLRRHLRNAPLLQHGRRRCGDLLRGLLRMPGGVERHLFQVLRRARRRSLPGLVVIPGARDDAAHQRNHEQHVDGLEPDGGENIEKLQLVVDLRHLAVGCDEVIDVGLIERALRQEGSWNRGDGQQEEQRQCGAHAGQPVPGLADVPHENLSLNQRRAVGLRP